MATRVEGRSIKLKSHRGISTVALLIIGVLSLFPFYWMVTTALTPGQSVIKTPPDLFPPNPTLDNFAKLFSSTQIVHWIVNTIIVATLVTAGHVLIASMAGYAFAKFDFPMRRFWFAVVLATIAIPAQVTLIPLFLMLNQVGLVNNLAGLILPGLADVFGVFMMRQFISTIPTELIQAARLDGASEWRIFWSVIMPLCKPALAVLALFMFLKQWNEFTLPLALLRDSEVFTLQVGVASMQGEFNTDYGLLMAGATIGALPVVLLYFLLRKYFMDGVRIGSIK